MLHFLVGKFTQYALVLFIGITLNFALPRAMPGNPLIMLAGEEVMRLSPQQRQELLAEFGLDQPVPIQYVLYLQKLAQGDLGYSYLKRRPIAEMIAERLPWTLLLTGTSLVLSTLMGVALGALAAWKRGGRRDLGLLGLLIFLDSLPSFWVGMMLIALFAVHVPLFPAFGAVTPWAKLTGWEYIVDVARHLVLPVVTLTIVSVPNIFLTTRYAMLSVLGQDFITVARAKGVKEQWILFRHALRNALLPVATVFTLGLGFAFGGATVIETVFSYPGIGRLIFEAMSGRDYPVVQAAFLMITITVIAANILADLLYPLLDPRVRREGSAL